MIIFAKSLPTHIRLPERLRQIFTIVQTQRYRLETELETPIDKTSLLRLKICQDENLDGFSKILGPCEPPTVAG